MIIGKTLGYRFGIINPVALIEPSSPPPEPTATVLVDEIGAMLVDESGAALTNEAA